MRHLHPLCKRVPLLTRSSFRSLLLLVPLAMTSIDNYINGAIVPPAEGKYMDK